MFEPMRVALCLNQDEMFYVWTNASCSMFRSRWDVLCLNQCELLYV